MMKLFLYSTIYNFDPSDGNPLTAGWHPAGYKMGAVDAVKFKPCSTRFCGNRIPMLTEPDTVMVFLWKSWCAGNILIQDVLKICLRGRGWPETNLFRDLDPMATKKISRNVMKIKYLPKLCISFHF